MEMHICDFFESHAALKEKCLASPPTAIFAEKRSTKRRKTVIKKRKVQASILAVLGPRTPFSLKSRDRIPITYARPLFVLTNEKTLHRTPASCRQDQQ